MILFFDRNENQLIESENLVAFAAFYETEANSRMADLFTMLDHSSSSPSSSSSPYAHAPAFHGTSFNFLPISLSALHDIMETLIFFSRALSDQYLLLDNGVPHLICSELWSKKPAGPL